MTARQPTLVVVVIAPRHVWRRHRGFRHAVIPDESHTLCGRDVNEWQGEINTLDGVSFTEAKIGCRVCIRAYEARQRADLAPARSSR